MSSDTPLVDHKPNTLCAFDNKHARTIMAEYATTKLAATAQIKSLFQATGSFAMSGMVALWW